MTSSTMRLDQTHPGTNVGTPQEVYNNPRDTFVASFVGSPAINLLPGSLSGGNAVVAPVSFELPVRGTELRHISLDERSDHLKVVMPVYRVNAPAGLPSGRRLSR